MNNPRSFFTRFIASLISFILIQTAPGMGVYSAVAQMRGQSANGASNAVSPAGAVSLSLPGANAVLPMGTLSSSLIPTLSAPNFVPNVNAMSVVPTALNSSVLPTGVVADRQSSVVGVVGVVAVSPLTVSPAASKPSLPSPSMSPLSSLSASVAVLDKTLAAPSVPAAEPVALLKTLSSLFDGSASKSAIEGSQVLAAASVAQAPALAAGNLSAAAAPENLPPSPPNEGPQAPRKSKVSIGLLLAGLGGGAAWLTHAWAAAFFGALVAPWIAVPALALTASWTALGVLAGFAAYSVETWKGFPGELKRTSLSAGSATFRFWARFGLIFDSVIRGKSSDEAMKKELSANILQYPVIAWAFVLAGYFFTPFASAFGAVYRLVATPLVAAFRGAREVVVGFLPWMDRVIRFVGRVIVRIFPFIGGFIWGSLKTAFFAAAAGAVILAGPIARDSFETDYTPASLPGWVAYRLTQLGGLLATLVAGAAGAVVGLAVAPLHVLMGALAEAFSLSKVSPGATAFFKRWTSSIEDDGGFKVLMERRFPDAGKGLTLAGRATRVLNGLAIAAYLAFCLPVLSVATLVRAATAASGREPKKDESVSTRRPDEQGAETKVEPRAGFAVPAVLGAIGLVGGAAAAFFLAAPLTVVAGAAALGAALGLALTQPQAYAGWGRGVASEGALAGRQAFGGWLDAGGRTAAALRGEEAPRASEWKLALALPAVLGGVASVLSALLGGLHGALAKPVAASWAGFLAVITQFLPALKRFLNRLVEVLKDIVPFLFGFVFGTIGGVLRSGWFIASNLFRPLERIFDREDGRSHPSEAQIGFGVLLGLTLVLPALAAFAGTFALGAVAGVPVALTHGLALGSKWAGTGSRDYYRTWEKRSLPAALRQAARVVDLSLDGEGREMPVWRLYVRTASFLLAAVPSALALTVAGGVAYARSLKDAKLAESSIADAPSRERSSRAEEPKKDETPAAKPPVWLAAALGIAGLAAGVTAAVMFGPAWVAGLAGFKLFGMGALAFAGVPALGLSLGLAASQPGTWTRLVPSTLDHAAAGLRLSLGYWSAAGAPVKLAWLYKVPGALLGVVWGAAGAVYGAAASFAVGAYDGARQVVYEILPFLRTAFETAMKVLRRIVPFVFGLFAGFIGGVVGSAAFGALLLGRPYFKHVVAEDFKHEGAIGFLANLFLKTVALVLGVAFGLAGIVAGVLAALPYALTATVACAFRFADIGGPVQKYFDHWTYGALRAEMRRLSQLTDRFQFPDGAPAVGDGWIRVANVFPATIAAAFAGTIAGWVGYFRSLGVAYESAKSGGPIPEPVVDQDASRRWDKTWRASKSAAKSFFAWGVAGALIGLGIMALTSWTPLGLAGWLLVGALAATGVVGALALGALIAALALVFWIDGQLR